AVGRRRGPRPECRGACRGHRTASRATRRSPPSIASPRGRPGPPPPPSPMRCPPSLPWLRPVDGPVASPPEARSVGSRLPFHTILPPVRSRNGLTLRDRLDPLFPPFCPRNLLANRARSRDNPRVGTDSTPHLSEFPVHPGVAR